MGAGERRKGVEFEREIARELSEQLGVQVRRRLGQARDRGCDLTQCGPFVIELKRRAGIAVYSWLEQVLAAATGQKDVPIVIARADGEESIVILRLRDFLPLMRGELGESDGGRGDD